MNTPRIYLHRLGSDPEFLFVKEADYGFVIVPASTVLGTNKTKTTHSFIGTDSRPILGELRPSPFRNLKRHLFELAYGLDSIEKHLQNTHHGAQILAYPELHGETLGGHIHASFFAEDPVLALWQSRGYTVNNMGQLHAVNPTMQITNAMIQDFDGHRIRNKILTPQGWAWAMSWLLSPFEHWIQPWVARETRNTQYGGELNHDIVRIGTSQAPKRVDQGPAWLERSAYLHWEYRLPSTWLHHPCLAYTYLGLAKLSMLNYQHIATAAYRADNKPLEMEPGPNAQFHNYKQLAPAKNAEYAEILRTRLANLYQDNPRITKDLLPLNQAIESCGNKRRDWFYTPTPIDIGEWRKLLIQ